MTDNDLKDARSTVAKCIKAGGVPTINLKTGRISWRGLPSLRIMEIAALNDDAHKKAVVEVLEARLK